MYYLNDFFLILTNMDRNSKFLLTMIAIIIVLLLIIIIISAISRKREIEAYKARKQVPTDREKIKEKLKKLDFQLENINKTKEEKEEEIIEPIEFDEPVENPLTPLVEEEKIEEKPVHVEKEEIEQLDIEDDDNEIERLTRELEKRTDNTFNLNEFEREQEKSAIISYDELVKRAGAKKIVYEKSSKPILDEIDTPQKSKGFTPTQIISPIYGTKSTDVKVNTKTREEKFESYKTGDREIDDDLEFLSKLKKFRRELQ